MQDSPSAAEDKHIYPPLTEVENILFPFSDLRRAAQTHSNEQKAIK